ncbi:hypothetical protein JTE90_020561 [Oedothorax gibbosus]|uniref:Uncharacterized protein n=1 Tax=Oedothorax gibbosus TaxID=931172 RepID=A0AAV6VZE1_9ARAC|nr:hypothetical protein JTE90_020561 [Oedothorax gibbosus]
MTNAVEETEETPRMAAKGGKGSASERTGKGVRRIPTKHPGKDQREMAAIIKTSGLLGPNNGGPSCLGPEGR